MSHRIIKTAVAAAAAILLAGAGAEGRPAAVSSRDVHPAFSLSAAGASTPDKTGAAAFTLAVRVRPEEEPPEEAKPAPLAMAKNWRRAFLEVGAFLAYSTIRYWVEYSEFIEDWQYKLTCEDQFRRFLTLEAVRFDSNCFNINWTHGLAGALYYQIARANRLTWAESFLAAFGGSLFYEYVGEWREVISVNDMILTSVGGYSLGEPWYQLAEYFHHQKSPVLRALGFICPFIKLNAWLDRKNPAAKAYANPGWHSFEISAGWRRLASAGQGPRDTGYFGLETQIIHLTEYGKPGVFRRTLRDTFLSEFSMELALANRRPADEELRPGLDEEAAFSTRVIGWASYTQNIDELSRGYALSVGLGSAFTYLRKRPIFYDSRDFQVKMDPLPETPVAFRDKMAVVHIAGPVVDWTRFARRFKLRAVADAYLDFAMMNAYAFNAYSAVHPIEGMKTTLGYYGYHYAFGASFSGRVDLEWGGVGVRALASWHVWDSIEGIDRFQNELADDGNIVDTRGRLLLKAGWRVPSLPLRLFASVETIRRWGRVRDVEASGRETRTCAGLSFLF